MCSDEEVRRFAEGMRAATAKSGARLLIGLVNDDLIGTIYGIPLRRDPTNAQVAMLAVEPTHWGEGIGSDMLDALTRELEQAGCRRLRMNVDATNTRARILYERHGWRHHGETEQVDDADAPELVYRTDLATV
jgi:ribosomal protein S18 acetylase RimI-like enzyme